MDAILRVRREGRVTGKVAPRTDLLWGYGATFFALFLLLFLRKPDTLTYPQFFAEDGRVFFHDQVLFGALDAISIPYAGYLHLVPRLVAGIGDLFPLSWAPALYNWAAMLVAAACCGVFLLPVFRPIVSSDGLRFAACCVAAAGIESHELLGTITQLQWYITPAAILLLVFSGLSRPGVRASVALAVVMLVAALSAPGLSVAAPLALLLLLRSRAQTPASWIPAGLLLGVAIQTWTYAHAGAARGHQALIQLGGLAENTMAYLIWRTVLGSMVGQGRANAFYRPGDFGPILIIGVCVLVWLAWLLLKADATRRACILGALYLAVSSVALSIGVRQLPEHRTGIAFTVERFFFLAACCLIFLVAVTVDRIALPSSGWLKPVVLLAVFGMGFSNNFRIPPFARLPWRADAEHIGHWLEADRAGFQLRPIIVNTPAGWFTSAWFILLDGTFFTNGGFEEGIQPWMPFGIVSLERTVAMQSEGQVGLGMSTTEEGGVYQVVRGILPGASMRARASVYLPCGQDTTGALIVQDGRGAHVATVPASPSMCNRWQKLETIFNAPRSGRVSIMLSLRGNGLKAYWDDVNLDPVADRLFASWGGYGIREGTTPADAGVPPAAHLPPWVSDATDPARSEAGEISYFVLPNLNPPSRAGTISVGTAVTHMFQFGLPSAEFPSTIQLSLFRPNVPNEVMLLQGALADLRGSLGLPGDQAFLGDWTGNGALHIGIFRAGTWYLDLNGNGRWDGIDHGDGICQFGMPGDIGVAGDWNGTGITKIGVFRCPAAGACHWILDAANKRAYDPATAVTYSYGQAGDKPVVGNWDGVGKAGQIGVFRCPTKGDGPCRWIVDNNGDGVWEPSDENYLFGQAGDLPVVSRTHGKIGIFRRGAWLLDGDGNHVPDSSDVWIRAGLAEDQPLMGEW